MLTKENFDILQAVIDETVKFKKLIDTSAATMRDYYAEMQKRHKSCFLYYLIFSWTMPHISAWLKTLGNDCQEVLNEHAKKKGNKKCKPQTEQPQTAVQSKN